MPGSDAAGTIVATGPLVNRFKTGDKVLTVLNQGHVAGPLTAGIIGTGLGGFLDGTFRQYATFSEEGLVRMPEGLTFPEASTLSCTGITAWNAFYGLRSIKPGDWVLTQGSGGLSTFALRFAKAAGARVIATTSSKAKEDTLKKLGADFTINYKEDRNWGAKARELTGGQGVNYMIEISGTDLEQSFAAIAIEGIITMVGSVAKLDQGATFDLMTKHMCTVRALFCGSRVQMEDMCKAVEANIERMRPVIDSKVFRLEDLREAYQYQLHGGHFGKICIEIDH